MWKQIGPYLPALIVLGVLMWRMSRNKASKVRLRAMWISPAMVLVAVVAMMAGAPPPLTLLTMAAFPAALALGGTFGWLRARHMELAVDRETGTLTSKATPLGMMLIVALFAARFALKLAFPEYAGAAHNGHVSAAAMQWTDIGILFSAGLVWARAVTLYLRARPLLQAHRAAAAE